MYRIAGLEVEVNIGSGNGCCHEVVGEVLVQNVLFNAVMRGQTGVIVENLLSSYPRALHTEVRGDIVNSDKRCGVTILQHSPILLIMLLRIDAGSLQHIP